jgi:hypothetical protein
MDKEARRRRLKAKREAQAKEDARNCNFWYIDFISALDCGCTLKEKLISLEKPL